MQANNIAWNPAGTRCTYSTDDGAFVTDASGKIVYTMPGGVGHAQTVRASNILLVVGGGHAPVSPLTHLRLWNDATKAFVPMQLEFRSEILRLIQLGGYLLVVLRRRIYVYEMRIPEFTLMGEYETADNEPAAAAAYIALAAQPAQPAPTSQATSAAQAAAAAPTQQMAIAMPKSDHGHVQYGAAVWRAHNSQVVQLAVSDTGVLASASSQGTIIRLWTPEGRALREFRRGTLRNSISEMKFGPQILVVLSSSSGHVYRWTESAEAGMYYFGDLRSAHSFGITERGSVHINADNTFCVALCSGTILACSEHSGALIVARSVVGG